MKRLRALQVVLFITGLLFCATIYPLGMFLRQEPSLAMMFSLYATMGIFLLLAVRNPSAHRSLIAFAAWSSLAHAGVMTVQAVRHIIGRSEVYGVVAFAVIGVLLLLLAPAKDGAQRASSASLSKTKSSGQPITIP